MNIRRLDSKTSAESFRHVADLGAYIRPILGVFQASEISRDKWLTDKERDFYVATVVHVLRGYPNPIQPESVEIYRQYFDPAVTKIKIADYIGRLRKKNWLKYDKFEKIVELPVLFGQINPEADSMEFNLKFIYEKSSVFG